MSKIKALETLREKIRRDVNNPWTDLQGVLLSMCNMVEHEIEESYMAFPLDANGVQIRVGDELECHANGYDGTFTVFAIGNETVIGDHEIAWIVRNPDKWFMPRHFARTSSPAHSKMC